MLFERPKRLVVTGWCPIEKYDPVKHDWVLLKLYDATITDCELVPRVGEYRPFCKQWFFLGEDEPIDRNAYDIRGFFDMRQLR